MDRNEKQNSYKNMVSSRGNNREIIRLKKRFHILSVLIVLLLIAVVCMGIFVGRMYQDVKSQKNEIVAGDGIGAVNETGSENGIEATNKADAENETGPENMTGAENETGSEKETGTEDETGSENVTGAENKTEPESNRDQKTEIVSETPAAEQKNETAGLQERVLEILQFAFEDRQYSCYVERKAPGEGDFSVLAKVEKGMESVESDELANLFVVGKVYQCLNDSFTNGLRIDDDNLRNYCLALLGRKMEADNIEDENALEELLQRIGNYMRASDGTANQQGGESQNISNLDYVRGILKRIKSDKTSLGGFGENETNTVYLTDVVKFIECFDNDEIWRNHNGADGATNTRDNLKNLFGYEQEESGSELRTALKNQFGDGYSTYWIEDSKQLNHIAILLEKGEDNIIVGLFAPENGTEGWSKALAEVIHEELDDV